MKRPKPSIPRLPKPHESSGRFLKGKFSCSLRKKERKKETQNFLRPLFFFSPQKNKEKQFPENLENIVLFLCSIFGDGSFFSFKNFDFLWLKKQVEIFCLTKCFILIKVFFSVGKQFHKIVENLSPKWYKSVNGRSVGSLTYGANQIAYRYAKAVQWAIENWSKYLPFMFRSLVIDLRGSKYLFANYWAIPNISLSLSHTHTCVYTIVTNI